MEAIEEEEEEDFRNWCVQPQKRDADDINDNVKASDVCSVIYSDLSDSRHVCGHVEREAARLCSRDGHTARGSDRKSHRS